jgi:hypothetical protein
MAPQQYQQAPPHYRQAPIPPPAQQIIHRAGNPVATGFGVALGGMLARVVGLVFIIVMLGVCVAVASGCCPAAIVGEDVEPPPGADEAIDMIHAEYQAAFDSPRRGVVVNWVASLRSSETPEGQRTFAWSSACDDVWIVVNEDRDLPSRTSLAHEIAHCYAGHMPESGCGSYDNSHAEVWVWEAETGLVDATDGDLAALGL